MYYAVKAGKRLEIDALNEAVVAFARRKSLDVPVNDLMTLLSRQRRRSL
jgi:2-dehydropantoate 2-reductase